MNASAPASIGEEVLLARAFLCRVAESACVPLWDFVRREGPVAAAGAIRGGAVPREVAAVTAARRASADPEADLEAGLRYGMRLVVPESPEWPHFALAALEDRKSTRLNSSHVKISYAVFCLKKKKNTQVTQTTYKKEKKKK